MNVDFLKQIGDGHTTLYDLIVTSKTLSTFEDEQKRAFVHNLAQWSENKLREVFYMLRVEDEKVQQIEAQKKLKVYSELPEISRYNREKQEQYWQTEVFTRLP